jgi:hypothetical protein
MIQIREMPDGNYRIHSSVSDFCDSMGYCEFRIKHFLKGLKPPQTQVTLEGTKSHEEEVEYEREHFKFVPITQKELEDIKKNMEFPREGIFTRFLTEIDYSNKKLSMLIVGQADKIARSNEMLIVEELKNTWDREKYLERPEPYEDHILQALLYLNSLYTENPISTREEWFGIPHSQKVWIIRIKDIRTGEVVRIFKGFQTKEAEQFLNEKIARFALIVLGVLEPEHHKRLNKCRSCRSFNDCEYKMTNS